MSSSVLTVRLLTTPEARKAGPGEFIYELFIFKSDNAGKPDEVLGNTVFEARDGSEGELQAKISLPPLPANRTYRLVVGGEGAVGDLLLPIFSESTEVTLEMTPDAGLRPSYPVSIKSRDSLDVHVRNGNGNYIVGCLVRVTKVATGSSEPSITTSNCCPLTFTIWVPNRYKVEATYGGRTQVEERDFVVGSPPVNFVF